MEWCRGRRGTALVAVLILLTLVSVFVVALASSARVLRGAERSGRAVLDAEEVARAGLEHALWALRHAPETRRIEGRIGNGAYEVRLEPRPAAAGPWQVTSTGTVPARNGGTVARSLAAVVQADPTLRILEWLE